MPTPAEKHRQRLRVLFQRLDGQQEAVERTRRALNVEVRDYSFATGLMVPMRFEQARREAFEEEKQDA